VRKTAENGAPLQFSETIGWKFTETIQLLRFYENDLRLRTLKP